jgi:hypothetical protein
MARIGIFGLLIALVCACSAPSAGANTAPSATAAPLLANTAPSATAAPLPTTSAPVAVAPSASGPALRTVDVSGQACAGIGIVDGTLRGDPQDPRVAWLDHGPYGTRRLVFPQGFTARFTPRLEILDANGKVKFRDGDAITEGCDWGDDLLIGWP